MKILVLALAVSGCGGATDPCDGAADATHVCLSATVQGNVTGLDQLRVSLEKLPNAVVSPSTPSSFSLPVKLAVVFPSSAAGSSGLTIEGLQGGRSIASTGKVPITIPASGRFAQTFTLTGSIVGDGGGVDGAFDGGLDGPPTGGVVVSPLSIDFPDTPRGTAAMDISFTVTNNNSTTASLTGSTATGDMNSFKVNPDPTAPSGCQMMMPSLPPGVSCKFNANFKPVAAGKVSQQNVLTFSDGTTATLTLTGTGQPVWSVESVPIGGNLEGVWGRSAADLYAFGHDATGNSVFHSKGDGTWVSCAMPGAILRNVFSMTGDANNIYIGLDSGQIYTSTGNCQWSSMNTGNAGWPSSSTVRGIFFDSTGVGWAVTDTAFVGRTQTGGAWGPYTGYAGVPTQLFAVTGIGSSVVGWVGTQSNNGFAAVNIPSGGSTTIAVGAAPLRSNWASSTTGWAVGDNTNIWRLDINSTTAVQETVTGGASGTLNGVSGRIDPATGRPDIYVVGYLGNQLLHSVGDGNWTSMTLPDGSGSSGVWVAPTGEVIVSQAAAANPFVLHYY
ncbi:MAG TPA: hypothetical protein VFF06_21710 [Polyangia bacterium]|nr:hypothetical protein [Polyangia bacterium]